MPHLICYACLVLTIENCNLFGFFAWKWMQNLLAYGPKKSWLV